MYMFNNIMRTCTCMYCTCTLHHHIMCTFLCVPALYCVHVVVTCISELWFSQNNCNSLNNGSISSRAGELIRDPPPPDTKLAVLVFLESNLHLLDNVLELGPLETRLMCSYWRDEYSMRTDYIFKPFKDHVIIIIGTCTCILNTVQYVYVNNNHVMLSDFLV